VNWRWEPVISVGADGHGAEHDEAKTVFDRFAEAGGNFIDTADQFGQSEELVGESSRKIASTLSSPASTRWEQPPLTHVTDRQQSQEHGPLRGGKF
jgi:aryl-alcohol dehydrogenase-like predicted oxidoreductase